MGSEAAAARHWRCGVQSHAGRAGMDGESMQMAGGGERDAKALHKCLVAGFLFLDFPFDSRFDYSIFLGWSHQPDSH